jgi:hypothetical protein
MVDVHKLKKPANRKGTPPPQTPVRQNLVKPASGAKVPLQLKISPELRREFRVYAAEREIDMSALFADMWTFYKEHHG